MSISYTPEMVFFYPFHNRKSHVCIEIPILQNDIYLPLQDK